MSWKKAEGKDEKEENQFWDLRRLDEEEEEERERKKNRKVEGSGESAWKMESKIWKNPKYVYFLKNVE